MLFKKEDKGLVLNEVQILGLDYTHELDDDFTVQEVNKFILRMKNNKATMLEHILDAVGCVRTILMEQCVVHIGSCTYQDMY
jgi:hypothetical protein